MKFLNISICITENTLEILIFKILAILPRPRNVRDGSDNTDASIMKKTQNCFVERAFPNGKNVCYGIYTNFVFISESCVLRRAMGNERRIRVISLPDGIYSL